MILLRSRMIVLRQSLSGHAGPADFIHTREREKERDKHKALCHNLALSNSHGSFDAGENVKKIALLFLEFGH